MISNHNNQLNEPTPKMTRMSLNEKKCHSFFVEDDCKIIKQVFNEFWLQAVS